MKLCNTWRVLSSIKIKLIYKSTTDTAFKSYKILPITLLRKGTKYKNKNTTYKRILSKVNTVCCDSASSDVSSIFLSVSSSTWTGSLCADILKGNTLRILGCTVRIHHVPTALNPLVLNSAGSGRQPLQQWTMDITDL